MAQVGPHVTFSPRVEFLPVVSSQEKSECYADSLLFVLSLNDIRIGKPP